MTRLRLFGGSFVIAAVLGSTPVLLLARAMLVGPKAVTSEFPMALLMPALGWLVPFAFGLALLWWRGSDLTPITGAILGFVSVCVYGLAIGAYLVLARHFDLGFLVLRMIFALPSAVTVSILTGASVWLAARLARAPSR